MLRHLLRVLGMAHLVLGVLAATVILTGPDLRRYGDNMRVALPALAWTCAIVNRRGSEFALRFLSMNAVVHGAKHASGDLPLNRRPNGGTEGFPSGHMAAAATGASALVNDCVRGNLVAQTIVVIAAAMVGVSRIEVGAHYTWQVVAGALLGWAFDRVLRKGKRRAVLDAWLARRKARLRALSGWRRAALILVVAALLTAVGWQALSGS